MGIRFVIEKVLVVGEERMRLIAEWLKRLGKEVVSVEKRGEALDRLREEPFDLVVSDEKFDLLNEVKTIHPQCLVIIAAAQGSVEAMKGGAFHYLTKPFAFDLFASVLAKAEEHLQANLSLREESVVTGHPHLICESALMKRIVQDLEKIAKSQASVFITGESGTGKEVIAGVIHQLSNRSAAPFVKVNCAAIPETLLESEFFGHERGAFTGALTRKIGRFELADRGTLLLDEVTEIPLSLQPKLLRGVQEQEFERVGGTRPVKVDVRFLAASNRNMLEAIETKIFREDLYYRLNVVPIHIPPLRERVEDILPLTEYFLSKFCAENHKAKKKLTERAKQKLLGYGWPGNVRELGNIMERTVVLDFDETIDAEHLYLSAHSPKSSVEKGTLPVGITLHELEKRMILETIEAQQGNRTKTAAILGISVRTLRNKLHEYGFFSTDD